KCSFRWFSVGPMHVCGRSFTLRRARGIGRPQRLRITVSRTAYPPPATPGGRLTTVILGWCPIVGPCRKLRLVEFPAHWDGIRTHRSQVLLSLSGRGGTFSAALSA